ncbi:uncharacterized protein LOC128171010 isoform X3 [Crassostrea angulata]|uniref:uncharacterized protein LOC128171010 isoform X3 n=1 Tax=Magallana angulata TaxID=2784310 RepID=UPI0022B1AE22|nr:uncharacterized protein LOC128171010 isoform X3 [Crassostrea angulata]
MDTASSKYSTHKCSKCPGDTEYYCVSCPCDLCPHCKENHVKNLQTIDHDVVSHQDKINYIPTQEICVRHPSHVYTKYCEPCELPVCFHCTQHKEHRTLDIRTFYKTKQQQHRGTIHTIRSEALFYRPVLLTGIKTDFKTCHTEFSLYQSEMLTKAQTLKHLINKVRKDFMYNVFCDFDFKHRCLKQMIEMSRHIVSLQEYELRYVQPEFTFSALLLLSFTKTALPQIHLTLHTSQLSMTESLNKEDVMESLSAIQITERRNRRVGNQCLLKLTSGAEFHQSLTLTGVDGRCDHISCVTSDRVWVSYDKNKLMLTDTTGVPLHRVKDLCNGLYGGNGLHAVNSESELIYIDRNSNINKLSKDMKTTTTFIERTDSTWRPQCVYWSSSTGDLLVAMYEEEPSDDSDSTDDSDFSEDTNDVEFTTTKTGKVTRYNQSGQLIQTIKKDNTGRGLYCGPQYITENNNGDVVVSDYSVPSGAVVVTERGGRHRFSYTGSPSGSRLQPHGICTDAMSHILVCDVSTKTVQMLDRDGQFVSHLLIRPSGIFYSWSLSYDVNTHRLWVGSRDNNTVVIYRYITRQDALTDLNPATADVMESLSEIPTTGTEKPQQGNQCLLKLMSPPELLHSLTVTGVRRCYHISCVTSDRVWVSDYRNNIILTDTTGVPLHRVADSCSDLYGLHTVNSESELIYIDRNSNINKLSKDMKTTTTFIERTDSTWRPRCVYWSPSTGDLLVGLYIYRAVTGKVTRYNQSGQLTQTIQNDNTGMGLYSGPNYITENNNGDVVVSDYDDDFDYVSGAVVVTERGGRHRFSYTGHPSGSQLWLHGICTDALSNILVCDLKTKTVQMLDRDGQFLSHLLIRPSGIFRPHSLSYDVNTHRLWVGSRDNNTVVIYRYITRQDALTDLNPATADVMESLSEIPTTGTEKPQQGNQCLLKLMSPPELLPSLTVTGVDRCDHISCVTSDRVWVSDNRNNLMLTDTTGVPLHRVEDSWSGLYGSHTVNSESELIYINRNYNINKLSKDMKTTTTFIERTDSTGRPQSVYWSPSTGDLLVGMYNYRTKTGKVTRYNQSGQLIQTIQNDNTGMGLYSEPHYITENNNGDVVVSDLYSAVVVTERGGRHRFSYTGHPSGSGLLPSGICTDALSHILVCDDRTKTVQMLDMDGQFLSHLLISPSGIFRPCSLSYDVNTHRLWVGSWYNKTVVIYRYITRQDALTDLNPATADVMESLSEIPTTGTEKPQQGNQCLLKLMSPPELLPSLTVTGVYCCYHISCVTSDRVWVSDWRNNLLLTDRTGVPLHRVEDSWSGGLFDGKGLHTVNSESELIYIDEDYNINKLSKDMKTTTTFIERTDYTWEPRCVYWSPSTGDLLVGMYNDNTKTGKVTRYNQSGQLTQTIQNNNTGLGLYREPNYITENNNGEVVVSDLFSAVVTERGGRHRFSYTGHPSGSKLWPRGICTDALSHILVCDDTTNTVQMLDRDGQFLSHLLIRPSGRFSPWSLSYDVNTHRLWVGSGDNNTVVIYRYITRQDALTDLNPATADVMESLSEIPTTGTEKPQQGNQCLLKLMSPPELLPSLTVTGVDGCLHISCVTSDRVWVSDDRYNLMLTDTTGVPLYRVEDLCSDLYGGLHTVNSESELIYIDRNYNINKLSKDMKTTTTFIERTDYTWRPRCVYWSPSTGDLLVGMYNYDTKTGKVTRYNQSGQLTHTIQNDNTGMGLYSFPIYITENNNGDVVVSDDGTVVVTERGGRHRFSYTGHPSGSGLEPRGICTDPLSHILVCDDTTETVQMLDRDGHFLSHLLIRPSGIFSPWSLSYDVNTHRLWVGAGYNNTVVIYRYITRQDALTDLNPATADVMESLSEIPTTGTEKPQQGNQCLLKLMSPPELLPSLTVTGVNCCDHISCVTSDRVWVSDDRNNLMLTDTTGVRLHRVEDSCSDINIGLHTVNSESELIYIDEDYNINKLSKDMKTTTTFIERTDSTLEPRCVYWSLSTGDLLVGMFNDDTKTGKVTRYNQSGQLTQTIQNDNKDLGLYNIPCYITENNNGDVVVSDNDAVVVTERGGRHRFSYTGHPSGSGLGPRGICTDPLSHILVCDGRTKTVQMLDRDGQFLSHLQTEMDEPWSLSYDVNTHRLWIGSWDNNTVVIYRYITRQDALTDLNPATADVMESLSEIPTPGTEKPQQGNQCLLKLMSPPALLHSLTLTGVGDCHHISCVTSDWVWVSGNRNNLMLTDTTGVPLHRVEDSCRYLYGGLHTVNSESELIYIDEDYNINKLSKDMKTTTTFIERTDSTWRPRCVYWSPSTGDVLVGMYNDDTNTGKVTRYNQSGQLTQTIQNDYTDLGLYSKPNSITENNNGDVVVSDYNYWSGAVVVTERGGRHRFSYTGHPSGSGLQPHGICTDPLSHILVCDGRTKTVQMIDRDGQFLSHLLIRPSGIFSPYSLSYDVNTHRLWVGSQFPNTVVIYRYITRQDALTDQHTPCPGGDALFSSTPAVE